MSQRYGLFKRNSEDDHEYGVGPEILADDIEEAIKIAAGRHPEEKISRCWCKSCKESGNLLIAVVGRSFDLDALKEALERESRDMVGVGRTANQDPVPQPKILVVEDSENEMARCKEMAKVEDFEFVFATNLKEALEALPECDVVITDLFYSSGGDVQKLWLEQFGMALAYLEEGFGMDGEEEINYLKSLASQKEVPYGAIIMLLAREQGKTVFCVTDAKHHSFKSNFVNTFRQTAFNSQNVFEGTDDKGLKFWPKAFERLRLEKVDREKKETPSFSEKFVEYDLLTQIAMRIAKSVK